jgi:hypothetical protein
MRSTLLFISLLLWACSSGGSTDNHCDTYGCGGEGGSGGSGGSGAVTAGLFCYRLTNAPTTPVCDCYAEEQDFSASEYDIVTSCDDPDYSCFADVRLNGDVDACQCYQPNCFEDDSGFCICGNGNETGGALDGSSAVETSSCEPTTDHSFCCMWSDGHSCWCQGGYCPGGGTVVEVPSCDTSMLTPATSDWTPVSSCTG